MNIIKHRLSARGKVQLVLYVFRGQKGFVNEPVREGFIRNKI